MSQTADDAHFDDIVAGQSGAVLVDFWAPWCKPCAAMTPILEQAELAANGTFTLVKVNVDECEQLADRFAVKSLPTLMLLAKDGRQFRRVGAASRQSIEQWIDTSLG